MIKQLLGTILALAYMVGVAKAFGSGLFFGLVSIFVPPVAIYFIFQ